MPDFHVINNKELRTFFQQLYNNKIGTSIKLLWLFPLNGQVSKRNKLSIAEDQRVNSSLRCQSALLTGKLLPSHHLK